MLKVGDEVSKLLLSYAVSGYVIFPIVLSFITLLIILKFFPNFVKRDEDPRIPSYFLWIIITTYGGIFGAMSILRYLSIHTCIFDFGIFDHAIWNIAKKNDFKYLAFGHFSPILVVYSLFYKVYSSGIILLILQTLTVTLSAVPLYYIARDKLRNNYYALLIVIIYFLYSPVQYNNLFDFHTDHLLILLMFLAFYFLEKKNPLAFILVCLPALFLKEPLILSVAMMGLYAMISHKMYKSGSFVLVGSLIFFFIGTGIIVPWVGGAPYGGGFEGSFSYLGKDIFQIIKSLIFHPGVIIKEAISVWKMGYIIFLFLPLLFIPFFSPFSLLPALPALIISLLSRLPNYYWIHVAEERDRVLDEAIKKFIPQQASVTSQNSVNTGYLAHRIEYYLFPNKIGEVDYVVLDRKRARFVGDAIDEERYNKEFERLLNTYEIVFFYDEIYIFKRKGR